MISNFKLSKSGIFGIFIVNVVQGYVDSIDYNMFGVLDDDDLNCEPRRLRALIFTSCVGHFGGFNTLDEAHAFASLLQSKGLTLCDYEHLIVA